MRKGRPIVTILGVGVPVWDTQPGVLDDHLEARKGTEMMLAIVLIVLAVLLGLGGLLFTAVKWLLIVAVGLLIAGVVAGVLGRRKTTSLR
jgi:hypothetical protein